MDLNILIPSGVNAALIGLVAWFCKRWMNEVCTRLTRLENRIILKKGD